MQGCKIHQPRVRWVVDFACRRGAKAFHLGSNHKLLGNSSNNAIFENGVRGGLPPTPLFLTI